MPACDGVGATVRETADVEWINQVERLFAELTRRQIRGGAHRSTRALERAIREYLALHNESPKPYRWTKSAGEFLGSLAKHCEVISDSEH